MLVIKDNDTVYIAMGAKMFLGKGEADEEWFLMEENLDMWRIPNDDGIIVAASGCGLESDLLKDDPWLVNGELTKAKIILEVVPKIKEAYKKYGKLDENGYLSGPIVFAQKNRAFVLSPVYDCTEIEEYYVRQGYESVASSVFRMTKGLPPGERFCRAAEMITQNAAREFFPFFVLDTKNCVPSLVKRDET